MQLDALKANFVAIASHELRTPATSVYGVLTTLLEHDERLDESSRRELLRVGVAQGERLRQLLEELLDLSRLDTGGVNVRPRPLMLGSVLGEIVSDALSTSASIELDVPDDLVVVADRLVLDRVVSNLLTNAVRYGADPITLSAESGRHASPDHGRGQRRGRSRGPAPRLFDRFSRTESANVGSGLGLAIARAYARAHGGDVVHDPGASGARFTLIIPHDRSPDQQVRVSKPELTS